MGTPSMVPIVAPHPVLTVDRTDARAKRPSDPTSEDKLVEGRRVTSALAELPTGDIEALKRASKKAKESGSQAQ
ncbi:hypothetical protein BGX24_003283 [Mortierella sp. AD032]|nr:hypothetical protein BGX24_003283 [Mortierella sp. AD032]